jgi:hypothetical protein
MLPFDMKNLATVDHVVVRRSEEEIWVVGVDSKGVERYVAIKVQKLHVRFFAGEQQVEYGAAKQNGRAGDGEFTTDSSGLKSSLNFLTALTGRTFGTTPLRDQKTGLDHYQPFQLLRMPERREQIYLQSS